MAHDHANPTTPLQRIIARRELTYEEASKRILCCLKRGEGATLGPGYLGKIATRAHIPSLKLGRVIVRWANGIGERLTLADLGIQTT